MDNSSSYTSSTTTSSAADNQLSSDKDSQTLFDEESIKSIIAQIKATRVVIPQQQLTDILCSYLDGKYSPKFIDQHLDRSFFGISGHPSAIFQAFGSDVIENYSYKPKYSGVSFLEVYKNRSQAGKYKNIYTHIKWTARQMLAGVRDRYDLQPVERSKRNTSVEFAQSKVVKIFIAFNLI